MAIIRFSERPFWSPWAEFEKMRQEMERMARRNADNRFGAGGGSVFPAINITEDADNLYIRAEVPGINPADMEISIENGTVSLKGERKPREVGEKGAFHRRELEYGKFSRAVSLPAKISMDKVSAQSADGILTIVLPKAEEAKPRQIAVKVG